MRHYVSLYITSPLQNIYHALVKLVSKYQGMYNSSIHITYANQAILLSFQADPHKIHILYLMKPLKYVILYHFIANPLQNTYNPVYGDMERPCHDKYKTR